MDCSVVLEDLSVARLGENRDDCLGFEWVKLISSLFIREDYLRIGFWLGGIFVVVGCLEAFEAFFEGSGDYQWMS